MSGEEVTEAIACLKMIGQRMKGKMRSAGGNVVIVIKCDTKIATLDFRCQKSPPYHWSKHHIATVSFSPPKAGPTQGHDLPISNAVQGTASPPTLMHQRHHPYWRKMGHQKSILALSLWPNTLHPTIPLIPPLDGLQPTTILSRRAE